MNSKHTCIYEPTQISSIDHTLSSLFSAVLRLEQRAQEKVKPKINLSNKDTTSKDTLISLSLITIFSALFLVLFLCEMDLVNGKFLKILTPRCCSVCKSKPIKVWNEKLIFYFSAHDDLFQCFKNWLNFDWSIMVEKQCLIRNTLRIFKNCLHSYIL